MPVCMSKDVCLSSGLYSSPETLEMLMRLVVRELPTTDELDIDVWRSCVVQDALREGRKKKFCAQKLLKVCVHLCFFLLIVYVNIYWQSWNWLLIYVILGSRLLPPTKCVFALNCMPLYRWVLLERELLIREVLGESFIAFLLKKSVTLLTTSVVSLHWTHQDTGYGSNIHMCENYDEWTANSCVGGWLQDTWLLCRDVSDPRRSGAPLLPLPCLHVSVL